MGVNEKERVQRQQRFWIKEQGLYVSDRQSIMAGEWLTDAVINSAQRLLKERYPQMGGLQMTTLGDTLTYTIEKGEFVQIINVRGSHWITISNIGCLQNHINVYDSIPYGDVSLRVKQQICALVFSNAKEIILHFPNVQSQKGGIDCGLFSIAFATTLCTGFHPADLQYNQSYFRDHLLDCIQKRFITPFPCTMITKKRPRSSYQQVVSLYCKCRQPEGGGMAQCDRCNEWYHEECVDLPKNIKSVKWFCPSCMESV